MPAVMTQWEYATEAHTDLAAFEAAAAERGREGWELVSVCGPRGDRGREPVKTMRGRHEPTWVGFFKRPLES